MIKKLLPILLISLVLAFPPSVFAEFLPEKDIIGETLYIEPDKTVIDENVNDGSDDAPDMTVITEVVMTKGKYLLNVALPFFALILLGVLPYIAEGIKAKRYRK